MINSEIVAKEIVLARPNWRLEAVGRRRLRMPNLWRSLFTIRPGPRASNAPTVDVTAGVSLLASIVECDLLRPEG